MKKHSPLILVSLLSACSTNSDSHRHDMLNDTGQPALHAVRDRQLRDLMDRMNSLMMERVMNEQELDVERRKQAKKIQQVADNLADTSSVILQRLPELNLHQDDQISFRALAGKLNQQAKQLKQQAERNAIDAIPATLEEMRATCTACHALFRKL